MNFNDYQEQAGQTAIYPNRESNLLYTLLGLCGETSEFADKVLDIFCRDLQSYPDDCESVNWELYDALTNFIHYGQKLERLKKEIRDENSEMKEYLLDVSKQIGKSITENDFDLLTKELGDVLWYESQASFELGVKFDDIAKWNVNKLKSRQQRNVLQGSGDDR